MISSSWVRTSIAEHSHVDNVSYGYFWWRPWLNVETPNGPQHVDVVAAQGNGGQKIYLVPQYDLVAVFTAGAYNVEWHPAKHNHGEDHSAGRDVCCQARWTRTIEMSST